MHILQYDYIHYTFSNIVNEIVYGTRACIVLCGSYFPLDCLSLRFLTLLVLIIYLRV